MAGKRKKVKKTVLALLDDDDKLIGYYKDARSVLSACEKENITDGRVLEVIRAFDVVAPDEPDYELSEVQLGPMLRDP